MGWRTRASNGKRFTITLYTTVVDKRRRMSYNQDQQYDGAREPFLTHRRCSAKLRARLEMTRPIRPANGDATSGSIGIRVAPTGTYSMMKLLRVSAAVTLLLCFGSAPSRAQQNLPGAGAYQAIPDFVGNNAGFSFRGAINDRLSGVQPISPRIPIRHSRACPPEQDGLLIYCRDCQATIPCAHSGSGAWAFEQKRRVELHRAQHRRQRAVSRPIGRAAQ